MSDYYDELKQKNPIEDVARGLIPGRITHEADGKLYVDCPHHDSQSGTSLIIDTVEGVWYCHACGDGGDEVHMVEFVMTGQVTKGSPTSQSHIDARNWLAERCGMPPMESNLSPEDLAQLAEERKQNESAFRALDLVTEECVNELQGNADVKGWIKNQYGLSGETLRQHRIGYFSSSVGSKIIQVIKTDEDQELLLSTGLFFLAKTDQIFPIFKSHIIFPHIQNGEVKYMAGRRTPWTPDTVFEKDKFKKLMCRNKGRSYVAAGIKNIPYGLDNYKGKGDLIIAEGYGDCLKAYQAGYAAISPATTHFSKSQIEPMVPYLKRCDGTIYIILDNEISQAGSRGALKIAETLADAGIINVKIAEIPLGEQQDYSS